MSSRPSTIVPVLVALLMVPVTSVQSRTCVCRFRCQRRRMAAASVRIGLGAAAHGCEDPTAGPQAARSKRLERQSVPHYASLLPAALSTSNTSASSTLRAEAPAVADPPPLLPTLGQFQCAPTAECHVRVAQLQDEKAFLAKYVERLLNQLRALLHKHGELEQLKALTDPQGLAESGSDNEYEESDGDRARATRLAPWLTSQEYTNPLLQAYDVKIYELERTLDENKKAMDRIVARAEALARENTSLRQEMEAESEKAMLRAQHDPKDLSLDAFSTVHDSGEYFGEINERIDENNMLMEQVSLQDDELSSMRKELHDRDQQLQIMGQNFNQATLALQELRDSCEAMRDEKMRCEAQLQQYAARIAQVESQRELLGRQVELVQAEKRSLDDQALEYEALLAAVKKNAERKDEAFATRYQNVCARLRELNSAVEHREKAVDELEEKNRALHSELEAARQDCEGMLSVLSGMEKQLTQYCNREDSVAELESDCKASVEEVVLEKEQLVAQEAQSRREIARLHEKTKQQTAEHLKAQEELSSSMKRRHEAELQTREGEVRVLSAEVAQLRVKLDAVTRSQKEAEKKLSDALRQSAEVSAAFEQKKLRQLGERAAAAEEANDASSRLEAEFAQKLRTKENELAKLRSEYRERTQELNEKLASLEREVELRRSDARELKDESEEKSQKIHLLNEQLQKVKADCAGRFARELEAVHAQNRELSTRAADAEYKLGQARKDAALVAETARDERERAEVRLVAEVESLKARLSALKDERSRAEKLRQSAESQCAVYALQTQQLARELADARELAAEREHACEDADRKVSELSAQVTIALSKQQQFYRQEREMRTSLERLTIDKTRMEREVLMSRRKLDEYRGGGYASLSQSQHRPFDVNERRSAASELHSRHAAFDAVEKPSVQSDVLYQVPS
ncbi:hypothetical protein PybrP1_006078 [[Pythium] brassicae (nom. inval.)]|nr:hypothetical protein PybrP1_006078 [[Pythium] brassicae (nom. inval.)]